MKQVFKVILITFLCTIGGVALLLGGAYVFGAFNEKIVYASNLYFNQLEVVSAEPFSLRINTSTEGVTKRTVKIETSQGAEKIINFPKTANIGEDFFISPITDSNNQNVGGEVQIFCRYDDTSADQSVVASCKIVIDVDVESCSVKLDTKQYELNHNYTLVSSGTALDSFVEITPTKALNPYPLKNLQRNKKIYLALSQGASFVEDDNLTSIVELPYKYNSSDGKFYITKAITFRMQSLGEMELRSYVCSTYKTQQEININNIKENFERQDVLSSGEPFVITNYTVKGMATNTSATPVEINFGEDVEIYLNNPKAKAGALNLGVELSSGNADSPIDDYFLKFNVFVKVANSDVKGSLRRFDGSTSDDGKLNVYYDGISTDKSTWCFKYKYSDFMAYYNYKSASDKSNKMIELQVWYENADEGATNLGLKSFYFIPKAKEISKITPKYEAGQSQVVYESGNALSINKTNFDFTYTSGNSATFDSLGYFIEINDKVVFYPTKSGNYMAKFSFTPTGDGNFADFSITNSRCDLKNAEVSFSQGENSYKLTYKEDGTYEKSSAGMPFVADKRVDVTISSLNCKQALSGLTTELFNIKINTANYLIKLNQTKFYSLDDGAESTPILNINGVALTGEYDFVDVGGTSYIRPSQDTPVTLSGIGSFDLLVKNIYEIDDVIYDLGANTATIDIYVFERLSSLNIYSYSDEKAEGYLSSTQSYAENASGGYLFITSSQLDTLKRLVDLGNEIQINVSQQISSTLSLSQNQLEAIANKNANAITFGELTEVKKDDVLVGYKVEYTIGEVYTLKIGATELKNIFDVSVKIDGVNNSSLSGTFFFEGGTQGSTWSPSIEDEVYKYIDISHSYSGGTSSNPIVLQPTANGSRDLVWQVSGTTVEKLAIAYGLKKTEADTDLQCAEKCSSDVSLDSTQNGKNIDSPKTYCTVNPDGISFKNVPYDANGVYFRIKFYVPSTLQDNSNSVYEWNGTQFVETLYEGLNENNGCSLYVKVIGLNITIEANNIALVGVKNNPYELLGTGNTSIFKVSGNNNINLNQVLTCAYPNMQNLLTVSDDYSALTVNDNFLNQKTCSFSFYVGKDCRANPIKINGVDSYVATFGSALEITYKNEFTAPYTDTTPFVTIKYKNGTGTDALNDLDATLSVSNNAGQIVVTINGLNVTFGTMTGTQEVTFNLQLKYKNESAGTDVANYSLKVKVVSNYTDNDLILGTQNGSGDYEISAGVKYKVGSGISFGENLNSATTISQILIDCFTNMTQDEITANIKDTSATMDSTIEANKHFFKYDGSLNDFYFESYDLNKDKYVKIVFKLLFSDNGTLYITKYVKLKANLDIQFKNATYSTGEIIDFSDTANYVVTRGGVSSTNFFDSTNFNSDFYNEQSFEFENSTDSKYFRNQADGGAIPTYLVCSQSSVGVSGTYTVPIVFTYKVIVNKEVLYTLDFIFNFTITIYDK